MVLLISRVLHEKMRIVGMKRIMAIIAAVLVALAASVEGRAQFSKLKLGISP